MLTWGYSKHPRKQIKDSQRIAVRPIQAYRYVPIRIQGPPTKTLLRACVNYR